MAEETILESIENLRGVIERKEVYYKTMISTHEVTISQQTIRIKKLEEQLAKAQEVVEDDVQTILRLQAEAYVPDGVPLLDWPWGEPEPYPFTHPIRDIPDYSKVRI